MIRHYGNQRLVINVLNTGQLLSQKFRQKLYFTMVLSAYERLDSVKQLQTKVEIKYANIMKSHLRNNDLTYLSYHSHGRLCMILTLKGVSF